MDFGANQSLGFCFALVYLDLRGVETQHINVQDSTKKQELFSHKMIIQKKR